MIYFRYSILISHNIGNHSLFQLSLLQFLTDYDKEETFNIGD